MTESGRRPKHIVGGVIVFGAGVFLAMMNALYVIEFIKGGLQPIFILIGLTAAAAAIFNGAGSFRGINSCVAVIFLGLGGYGLYDEYYATVDFFNGFVPLLLIVAGTLPLVHGINSLRKASEENDESVELH